MANNVSIGRTVTMCPTHPRRVECSFQTRLSEKEKSSIKEEIDNEFRGKVLCVRWSTNYTLCVEAKSSSLALDPALLIEIRQFLEGIEAPDIPTWSAARFLAAIREARA